MPDPAFERLPFLGAEPWRVVVVNPTGRYARNQVAGLVAAGTPLVGGVALGRGGETMDGLPLYDRVADLPERPNVAVLYTPAEGVRDAIAQCADAGIRTIVAAAEYVPVHDALDAVARARAAGAWLIGPNTLGMYVPGRGLLGSIAPSFCTAGRLAVVARSGTLTLAMARQLTLAGIGQSLVVHIGGDTVATAWPGSLSTRTPAGTCSWAIVSTSPMASADTSASICSGIAVGRHDTSTSWSTRLRMPCVSFTPTASPTGCTATRTDSPQ